MNYINNRIHSDIQIACLLPNLTIEWSNSGMGSNAMVMKFEKKLEPMNNLNFTDHTLHNYYSECFLSNLGHSYKPQCRKSRILFMYPSECLSISLFGS